MKNQNSIIYVLLSGANLYFVGLIYVPSMSEHVTVNSVVPQNDPSQLQETRTTSRRQRFCWRQNLCLKINY